MITRDVNGTLIGSSYATAVKADNRDFLVKLLMNGTELSCGVKRLEYAKGSCADVSQFSVGSVIGGSMTAEVLDLVDDVKGQTLEVQVGLFIESLNRWTYIKVGEYKISEVKKNIYGATLTGYGKLVSNSGGSFTEPSTKTLANIATEIGTELGCNVYFDGGINSSRVVSTSMNGLTTYQALQLVCTLVGGYAVELYTGDVYIKRYVNSVNLDVNTGMMNSLPEIEEQDFEITGVECIVSEASSDSEGDIPSVGYTQGSPVNLVYNCANMTQDIFTDMATNLIGYTYRPGTINLSLGDPRLEGVDVIRVTDADENTYLVPCHSLRHIYDGGFRTECTAASATHVENSVGSVSPMQDFQKQTQQNFVTVESEIENLAEGIQYFWHDNDGAHVATIPQSLYETPTANLRAYEVLITSANIEFRRGQSGIFAPITWTWTTVATYANDGITLGDFASMTSSGIILGDINDSEYQMQLDSATGIQLNGRPVVVSDYATSAVSETTTTMRVVAGLVNSDSTQITFTVPLECIVPEAMAIDVTALRANIKIDGTSYFVDGSYMNQGRYWVVASNTYTVTAFPAGTGLTIQITKTTGTFKQGATSTAVAAYSSVTVEVDRVEWTKPAINRLLRASKSEEETESEELEETSDR